MIVSRAIVSSFEELWFAPFRQNSIESGHELSETKRAHGSSRLYKIDLGRMARKMQRLMDQVMVSFTSVLYFYKLFNILNTMA